MARISRWRRLLNRSFLASTNVNRRSLMNTSIQASLYRHRFAAAAVLALCTTSFALASTSGGASSSGSTASAYTDTPQSSTTYTSTTYSPSYDGYSGYSGYSSFGSYSSYSYTIQPRRYFFPPNPPALGEPYLKNRTKSASLGRSSIPIVLSDYVNEPFYAPLSPFLYEEDVSKRRQKAIDDYQAQKLMLIAELRAKIDALQNADAATRESQLADFAREQSPRIAAAESAAYDIRDDLTRPGIFSDGSDWNEGRTWRLGQDIRYESTMDEAKVMRGAAFFQNGLSPAQRRLLREYAMQLDDSARGPGADMALNSRGPYFYFSPEMSRVRLPANLPPELQAKIDSYRQQKAAIVKELRDELYRHDRDFFDISRRNAMRTLAEKQAGAIAALDPLAEEIRHGLAQLPNIYRPASTNQGLPAPLGDKITKYMTQRAALTQTLNAKMQEVKRLFPTSRVEFVRMEGGYGIMFVPNRKLSGDDAARAESVRLQLVAFNQDQIRTFVSLVREKESVRESLIRAAGPIAPIVTPRIVDLILTEYSAVVQQQELWNQYRDYEIAVLQPGLSPEQRRLLFGAALVKLDQQLPYYTY
jgi:hypothetical protein